MIRAVSKYWWIFSLRGIIAIVFGLAALLWPALTLGVMVLLFGLFALFEGLLAVVTSFGKGDEKGGWTLLFEGLAGVLVCVIVLLGTSIGSMFWPRVAAVMLVYYIAGWAILAGLFKIITAFRIRSRGKRGVGPGLKRIDFNPGRTDPDPSPWGRCSGRGMVDRHLCHHPRHLRVTSGSEIRGIGSGLKRNQIYLKLLLIESPSSLMGEGQGGDGGETTFCR